MCTTMICTMLSYTCNSSQVIGYAVVPLFPPERVTTAEINLPVVAELPYKYLEPNVKANMNYLEDRKASPGRFVKLLIVPFTFCHMELGPILFYCVLRPCQSYLSRL